MAKRLGVRTLSDAARRASAPSAKPARVSYILNGIKYKPGQAPVRVCPQGKRLVRRSSLAAPV
jgi:hypothetical protein